MFSLKANRGLQFSEELLTHEMQLTCAPNDKALLLATGVLLRRQILIVDDPHPDSANYLHDIASSGTTVIVASNDNTFISIANNVVEIASNTDYESF